MYARLPSTYELIEALRTTDVATPAAVGGPAVTVARVLWAAFIAAVVPAVMTGSALAYWNLLLRQTPPTWLPEAFHVALAASAACYLGAWLARAAQGREALWHPLRWMSRRLDSQCTAENALLLQLGRIPPLQLRARQRRVALQVRMWDGAARTVAVLLALGPAAFVLFDGATATPTAASIQQVVAVYGAVLVAGAAFALFAQLQCSGPLRRLAHVLGEAAEINEALGRAR
ncbi:hypothetical protein [Cupriavidus plantarum]|uniref:Uncharacterized protein n=1 Tax=Cupriavidus plantarum TaxID=942865 RepID=A0A316EKL7_9BURK|nr:hypothetical protein [Cupriavidus plantarum]NYH97296.1 hypothetical protein [Cupriavidus plantarum]PWK31939.1 hypothetical protein C7419_10880 [Cupriavidus plantarum]REE86317.1 hypothetical protein C7418_5492 [Cupriavidus plantarum]RLK29143.1 hypothetical protein C7417_5521 [Cupriavidus plantarum]CAG2149782.1 hypothetical protein LMG26296_04582 [Cupriavidus plantarum]